jgi:hypothetical protein
VKKADYKPGGSLGAPDKLFAEHWRIREVFGDPAAWPNAAAANDYYAPRRTNLLQRLLLLRRRQTLARRHGERRDDHRARDDKCGD